MSGQRISKNRFDITVADNHNYFVDGCLVSNSPETTPGGLALKFYSSVRVDVRRSAQIKKGDEVVGNRVKAKIIKNKVAPPFKITEFDIIYGEGISYEGDVLNFGLKHGVIKRAGASYSFVPKEGKKKKLGVGFETAREKLKEDSKILNAIKKEIMNKLTNDK